MRFVIEIVGLYILFTFRLMAQYGFGIGAIDASSYPNISVKIRCVHSNSLIQNLSPNQFILTEDSVRRQVTVQCPDRKQFSASVAFGIDRSMGSKVQDAKAASDSMLRRFRFPSQANDEVSVWSFASFPNKDLSLNQNISTIRQTINSITEAQFPFNGTSLYETMHRSIEDVNEFGRNIPKAIIFFTDGVNHTKTYSRTLDEVRIRANISSIKIYVVGMAAPPDGEIDMRQLCDATGGFFVPNSSPQALDSIYSDLTSEPVSQYFCTLDFTTTNCPDGSQHQIQIKYIPTNIDTLVISTSYNTPRIESLLQSIPIWIIPDSIQFLTNKKDFTIAFGMSLASSQQFNLLEFFISHPSSVIIDSIVPDQIFQNADIRIIPTAGGSRIHFSNLLSPIPQGQVRFGLLKIKSSGTNAYRIAISLTTSIPGCKTSNQIYSFSQSADVSIDTVLGQVGKYVTIPVRVSKINLQEGLQQLKLNIHFANTAFLVDTSNVFRIDNSIGWSVISRAYKSGIPSDTIVLVLEGQPLFRDAIIAYINLHIKRTASRFNQVTIDPQFFSTVNSFGYPQPTLQVHNGLVFLQDTCRGDLSLIRVPYNQIRQNSPNPFGSATLTDNPTTIIPFTIAKDGEINMYIYDVLGRQRGLIFHGTLLKGDHQILFNAEEHSILESGVYFVTLQTDNWTGIIKISLLR